MKMKNMAYWLNKNGIVGRPGIPGINKDSEGKSGSSALQMYGKSPLENHAMTTYSDEVRDGHSHGKAGGLGRPAPKMYGKKSPAPKMYGKKKKM